MNADQAWQAAIGQLQMEMPKSTFDTWVRDTELIVYEDGVFILSAQNAYARDWLDGRLSSTVKRLLTGLMNCSVEVRFVVSPSADEDGAELEVADESGNSHQAGPDDVDTAARLELVHASLRDSLVGLGIVPIPGYFRRWVPYLGSYLSWIYIAFRQVFFLSTSSKQINNTTFEIRPSAGAYWAGIDRKLFRQHMDDWMLGWFLEKDMEKEHSYRFRLSMPLTPGDAEALLAWLIEAGIQERPIEALEKALASGRAILPNPPPPPTDEHLHMRPDPLTVQDVVLKACGRQSKETLKMVMLKADELAVRIMPPQDLIVINHYFLRQHLAVLGANPAMLVTLLRDECYIGKTEMRDTVWKSISDLAAMLGLQRETTVIEWLPPFIQPISGDEASSDQDASSHVRRKSAKRAVLANFLQRIDYRDYLGKRSWKFQVALTEPLNPSDLVTFDAMLDLAAECLSSGSFVPIEGMIRDNQAATLPGVRDNPTPVRENPIGVRDNPTPGKHGYAIIPPGIRDNPTPVRENPIGVRDNPTLSTLINLFKILKHLDSENTTNADRAKDGHFTTHDQGSNAPRLVVGENWNWSVLFAQSNLQSNARKQLLENGAEPVAYVSWLIYAHSPAGKGIESPTVYAYSRLRDNPKQGAGPDYEQLASLSPQQLYSMISDALERIPVPNPIWQKAMGKAMHDNLLELRGLLFMRGKTV